MSHEAEIKSLLERGKAGEALAYLARQLDALEADRAAAPSLDWTVGDVALPPEHHAMGAHPDEVDPLPGRDWPVYEGGPVLQTAAFGWDGSPDTWTKEIGEGMYRAALTAIGDPLPGDGGEWSMRRSLAQDLRTPPTRDVLYMKGENLGNSSYSAAENDEYVEFTLPTPTEEERIERQQFALQLGWDQPDWLLPTGGEPIIDSFIEGGPLMMFLGYREYLEQIPAAMRARMIAMHAQRFPMDAAIMTADLLRGEDELDYERALEDAGRRSNTLEQ